LDTERGPHLRDLGQRLPDFELERAGLLKRPSQLHGAPMHRAATIITTRKTIRFGGASAGARAI
jgi:hypothetical protein